MAVYKDSVAFSEAISKKSKSKYSGLFSLIVLLAVMLTVVVVTVRVYSAGAAMSAKAGELSGGTTLCRNIAELYTAASGEDEFLENAARLGYVLNKADNSYMGRFNQGFVSDVSGVYTIKLIIKDNEDSYGNLQEITVDMYNNGESVYQLETAKYISERGDDGQ